MVQTKIDFDGQALALIDDAYSLANNVQTVFHTQYRRDWLSYNAFLDMSERDPDMPNIALPKLFSIVETKAPADTDALFGIRPIIPFEARRDEFEEQSDIQTEVLDELLHKAGIYEEGSLLIKMKILFGTSFMDVLPLYELVTEKSLKQTSMGLEVKETKAWRLRLKVETWAPWEVLVDPFATNLSTEEGCRYVLKLQLASKRAIKELFTKGAYPNFDIERLDAAPGSRTTYKDGHKGLEMMRNFGIPEPQKDDDMGILVRYESPERYIDSWMGEVVLRDIDNPFKHKKINLSKITHVTQPHSQARFWGIGEAKPNEIQIAMLNDLWNLTLAAHAIANQPAVFFRKGHVNMEDIVFGVGRRIPVDTESNRPITDDILVHGGTGLPTDHYNLPAVIERNIDLTSGQFAPGRGEVTSRRDTSATEILTTTELGNQRQEGSIKLGENSFMADFGSKAASIVDQFGTMGDVAETVGQERAFQAITMNPAELPGGFNIGFKGSGRVADERIKFSQLSEIAPLLIQSPTVRPGGVERTILKLTRFNNKEIDEMQLTEEEIAQQQQQQLIIQAIAAQGGQKEQESEIEKTQAETGKIQAEAVKTVVETEQIAEGVTE